MDLFSDFNGLPEGANITDFYEHDANWSNRMILGDSLQVMASLAEREGLRGKVQCIYIDPPYGMKFNSNFQWSTTSRDVRDGNVDHITREPEQVKAFRDTWAQGIHSYLSYLRDRLESARELLADTGSVFVQIGDENVHRVRALMDEVFGERNFVSLITIQTTSGFQANYLGNMSDFVLWYAKGQGCWTSKSPLLSIRTLHSSEGNARWILLEDFTYRGITAAELRGTTARCQKEQGRTSQATLRLRADRAIDSHSSTKERSYDTWEKNAHWKANHPTGMERLARAGRIHVARNSIQYIRFH